MGLDSELDGDVGRPHRVAHSPMGLFLSSHK